MMKKYISTGTCIWCKRQEPEVTFWRKPHIVPESVGGSVLGSDICDKCNHFFGTAEPGGPSIDCSFSEIFGAFRMFGKNLDQDSYKKYKSALFEYRHSKHLIRVKRHINSAILTERFKRSLYEVFLQAYHEKEGNANNPMFDFVREYARYGRGAPKVFYAFNNVILGTAELETPFLSISDKALEDLMETGCFRFWFMNHVFYLEVFPTLFCAKGNAFLKKEKHNMIIPAIGNEDIFELKDIMQVDFFMQRFNQRN